MKNKTILIGGIFLLLQLMVIIRNILAHDGYSFFWYCDLVPIVFALSFFTENWQMAKGMINIGIIIQWAVILELTYYLFTGTLLFGFSHSSDLFDVIVTYLLHLSATFALIFTYKIKPTRKALIYSLLFLTFIYLITLLFTSPSSNTNLVYSTPIIPVIPYYTELWILIAFIIVILPTHLFQKLLFKLSKKD